MSEQPIIKSSGPSFVSLLTILFITLKLTGVIAWSWWWVLSPMWICGGIALVCLVVIATILHMKKS